MRMTKRETESLQSLARDERASVAGAGWKRQKVSAKNTREKNIAENWN